MWAMATKKNPLEAAREAAGLSYYRISLDLDMSRATVMRIHKGMHQPTREHARAIFEYYNGAVTLGQVYDPQYCG